MILSHSTEKGGVGKTTIEYNQAYRLAEQGKRVLIINFDGQRNMDKTVLGGDNQAVQQAESGFTSANLFDPATKLENVRVLQSPLHENIHLIPTHKANIATVNSIGRSEAQSLILNPAKLIYCLDYDYIIIDTPPSLGVTQMSALATVDKLYIPVMIEDFSAEGLESLLKTVQGLKVNLNCKVELAGIYINCFEKPTTRIGHNPEKELLDSLEARYKGYLITPYIPRGKYVKEARMNGLPAWKNTPNGGAAVVGRKVKASIDAMNERL
ncbi:AAA family ATPase [Vibrio europaeus]|nr:AAA family ATPase [Vibrio europaeus]